MVDDSSRGAARSRLFQLPVLRVPAPNYRKQVNEPGSCCGVWRSDSGTTVLKAPLAFHLDGCDDAVTTEYEMAQKESAELIEREEEIYRHLGKHKGILTCLQITDAGLIFPYMKNSNLRHFLRNSDAPITQPKRLDWVRSALSSIDFIHSKGVFQADISTRNFLVADDLSILLCDFSGSTIHDKKNMVRPETRYEKSEGTQPVAISVATEVFSVGSLIYEISTGKRPYDEVEDDAVERLFRRKVFPSTTNVYLGDIIKRCWLGDFESVAEVSNAVRKAHKATES